MMPNQVFQFEQMDETAVLIPEQDLRELDFDALQSNSGALLDRLDQAHVKNVVIDFHKTDYYGSTALAFFVKLWKRLRQQGGRMAFCNVSPHEREILEATQLDTLWSICDSREDALAAVRK